MDRDELIFQEYKISINGQGFCKISDLVTIINNLQYRDKSNVSNKVNNGQRTGSKYLALKSLDSCDISNSTDYYACKEGVGSVSIPSQYANNNYATDGTTITTTRLNIPNIKANVLSFSPYFFFSK